MTSTDPVGQPATAVGDGPLLLPVSADTAAGDAPFAWPTLEHDGRTHVLAFTSEEAIAAALPGESVRYITVELAEVAASIPDDSWILTVDPGTPTATQLSGADLRELSTSGIGAEAASALRAAVAAEDPDALMAALLRAEFTVPLAPADTVLAQPPESIGPDFPWWCLPDEQGRPSVPVFTSAALMRQALGDGGVSAVVHATSARLFANWPDPDWQLAVNPGTPLAVSLPGTAVQQVSRWLDDLRRDLTDATAGATGPGPGSVPAGQSGRPAAADAERDSGAGLDEPDPDAPLLMQVLIPHRYLHSYVTDGYDRVAGLVNRWYGPGRDTPARLYARLALLGPQSPFSAGDEWVPVVRWTPGPDTPTTWLDHGPQHHALVVPDGAGLHIVHQDGRDELLARFEAESRQWLPAGEVPGSAGSDPSPAG